RSFSPSFPSLFGSRLREVNSFSSSKRTNGAGKAGPKNWQSERSRAMDHLRDEHEDSQEDHLGRAKIHEHLEGAGPLAEDPQHAVGLAPLRWSLRSVPREGLQALRGIGNRGPLGGGGVGCSLITVRSEDLPLPRWDRYDRTGYFLGALFQPLLMGVVLALEALAAVISELLGKRFESCRRGLCGSILGLLMPILEILIPDPGRPD